jgi:hypothetical protein
MISLTLEIPDDVALTLSTEAIARKITIEQLAIEQLSRVSPSTSEEPRRSYASYFGIAKGQPGALGSVEAIDRYVSEQRNEW